jgi:hypothetical protein
VLERDVAPPRDLTNSLLDDCLLDRAMARRTRHGRAAGEGPARIGGMMALVVVSSNGIGLVLTISVS